jgi:TldD protein
MNIIEPGIRNLALAKDILLTPYGLDESLLTRTIADIFTHRVDYADLYFQATRSEAWSLEEGIVKSGSFSIDQGVGVRAVAGDRTAFAYSTTCRRKPSPRRPRPPGDRGGGRRPPEDQGGDVAEGITGRDLYLPSDPLARSTRPPRSSCSSASSRWRAGATRASRR